MNEMLLSVFAELKAGQSFNPDLGQPGVCDEVVTHRGKHGDAALYKHGHPSHLTVSTFVFDRDAAKTLLSFHRKGQFWVQLGGHIEVSDASLREAALREFREESGVGSFDWFSPQFMDIDVHAVSSKFGNCKQHLDVAYAVVIDSNAELGISVESDALAWWPIDDLPPGTVSGLRKRLLTCAPHPHQLMTRFSRGETQCRWRISIRHSVSDCLHEPSRSGTRRRRAGHP